MARRLYPVRRSTRSINASIKTVGSMDDIWTIIAVVWLLAWLLAAIRVVKTNNDLWAGIGVACLGFWSFAAGWAFKWVWW